MINSKMFGVFWWLNFLGEEIYFWCKNKPVLRKTINSVHKYNYISLGCVLGKKEHRRS